MNQFDNLCKLAALICNATRAVIVLKGNNELQLKASFGDFTKVVPQKFDFAATAIGQTEFFEVPDTLADERFYGYPHVLQEPFLRFYAGAQVFDEQGNVLGLISVSDQHPGSLSEEQKEAMRTLANEVLTHLSLEKKEAELNIQRVQMDDLLSMSAISPEIYTVFDYSGNVLFMNHAVEKILGYTPHEVRQMSIWNAIYSADIKYVQHSLENGRKNSEKQFSINSRINTTAGEIKMISWNIVDRNNRWYAYGRDITETKRVENELTNLSFVASKVNNAIVINDGNNHVTWVNEAFQNITGFTLADLKGKRLGDLISGPKTDLSLIEEARAKNRQNESFTLDLLAYRKDKRPIWISIYNTLIFDERDQVSAEVEIIIDITDKKMAEQEMLEAKEQALQLSEAKEMFVSVMSHEIRTPLNAILGMTHLLMETDLTPSQKDDLNILKFSGENLLNIVNDVLDFTKMETGHLQLEAVPFSLRLLVKDILNSLQVNVSKRNNQLNLVFDQAIPERILGDKTRLYQILMNLLGNAIKFTSNGVIELEIKQEAAREEEIVLFFKIEDNGIGIPADKQKYVFESFTQARSDISRKYGGTGLGLAITKKLLKLHGSDIELKSVEGQGSIFSFRIAFDKLPVAPSVSSLKQDVPAAFKGKRVLVVDDNQINLLIAKRILNKWGLFTEVAYGGLEAIEMVKNGFYDLVFMDVKMPDLDGFDTTVQIRQMEGDYFKTLPIIALTATALGDELVRYHESGMNGHLMKPLNPEAFKHLITEFLSE